MTVRFDAVVILAEMRTGSNHLQESLNALSDICVHGEIFNPAFIGERNRDMLFGLDLAARDANPHRLLDCLIATSDRIPGFRYFGDHDPRIRSRILEDPRIAKVILTRDDLACYVSLKIAQATDQWRLTNPKMAKTARVAFDAAEFDAMRLRRDGTRATVRRTLQRTGQAAFSIDFSEITDLEVLNGLAAFLGSQDRLSSVPDKLKRQNPGDIRDLVTNPDEMTAHLLGSFSMGLPTGPLSGPSVPRIMAAKHSPVLFLPLPGGPERGLRDWLTALDGDPPVEGMRQKELRDRLRNMDGPTVLAVLRHPLHRAHRLFWDTVLIPRGSGARDLRRILRNQHKVPVPPKGASAETYDKTAHGAAFLAFLEALPALLGGQTSLSAPGGWFSQSHLLAGMAQAVLPHRILHEKDAGPVLRDIATTFGKTPPSDMPDDDCPIPLSAILTDSLIQAATRAYRRDYVQFGFQELP